MDGGANSGLASADVHVLAYADIMGVGQSSINTFQLVTCTSVHMAQGPIALIMNKYVERGEQSIH